MEYKKLHIHSMIVHAIMALTPIAALSHVLSFFNITVLGIDSIGFKYLTFFSILVIFILSLPSMLSGISEIMPMYMRWHRSHRMKVFLSILLIIGTLYELFKIGKGFVQSPCVNCGQTIFTFCSFLIVIFNNIVVFLLSYYGLKKSLGRQSFEGTSYVPDFFNKVKPVDILELVKEEIKEKRKIRGISELSEGSND